MQRPLSSWGISRELRHKAHCGIQRILFTSCPLTELQSEGLHTHGLPTASTWARDHQQKWLQTKAKWSDKAGPLQRVLRRGYNTRPHLPSQGKGLGEPTLALWDHPITHQQWRPHLSERSADDLGRWSLWLTPRQRLQAPPLHPEHPGQVGTCRLHSQYPWRCTQGPGVLGALQLFCSN